MTDQTRDPIGNTPYINATEENPGRPNIFLELKKKSQLDSPVNQYETMYIKLFKNQVSKR